MAIDDCEIVEFDDKNTQGGIHAKNLFVWNSLIVKLKDGTYVEYVHIQANSVQWKVGDKVPSGEVPSTPTSLQDKKLTLSGAMSFR